MDSEICASIAKASNLSGDWEVKTGRENRLACRQSRRTRGGSCHHTSLRVFRIDHLQKVFKANESISLKCLGNHPQIRWQDKVKPPQHLHHHPQGSTKKGRPRLPHIWPPTTKSSSTMNYHRMANGRRASKTLQRYINTESWKHLAYDRSWMRHLITNGVNTVKKCRSLQPERKREVPKARVTNSPTTIIIVSHVG